MIKRELSELCLQFFKQYPVITITGPRQSGKTTLAKSVFPDLPYVNLEEPDSRRLAIEDPRGFLAEFNNGVILDEIQRAPEIPSYIQSIVDRNKKNGMFVLTGSQQFEVSQSISQSLAGRTSLIKLLPFSMKELGFLIDVNDLNGALYRGFYPKLYNENVDPSHFYMNYFETYIQRDLRQLSQIDDLMLFEKFVRLLAGRIGQLVNYNSLANDLGLSQPTLKKWLRLLEASYLVFLLQPFYRNLNKRFIKTPKIYFYDVGLAAYLLGIETTAHIKNHPLRGNLFENLVVAECLKNRFNQAKLSNLYFFRDRTGNEVDMIFECARHLVPVEIKASETMNMDYSKGLKFFRTLFPEEVKTGYIVYAGSQKKRVKNEIFLPLDCLSDLMS
ncbi:MAG: ATP-binding protein [Candidatus Omnitrophota bacterium]